MELSLNTTKESLALSSLLPSNSRGILSLPVLSASPQMKDAPIPYSSSWPFAGLNSSLFCTGDHRPGPHPPAVSHQDWVERKDHFLDLLAMLFLLQPWVPLATFTVREHCWLRVKLFFPSGSPQPSLQICFPDSWFPLLILIHGVSHESTQAQTTAVQKWCLVLQGSALMERGSASFPYCTCFSH